MHTCPIKIRVMIFTVSIFSTLNSLGFHAVRAGTGGVKYGATGRGDNFDARSIDSNSSAAPIPVPTGFRAHTPDTAERVITGSGSTDSREVIFERGSTGSKSLCARLCAYLCCREQD